MKNANILAIVLLIAGLGAGFFAGMKYQQRQVPAGRQYANGGGIRGLGRGGNVNLRPIAGQIISSDDKSITVKLADGSSKIVFLIGSTVINKSAQGTKTDLTSDARVAVFGIENSDGSITAQNIQLNPMYRMGSPSASPR